ncbi:MAG TPA: hypothetical protein DEQ64_22970 [Lachnoclostridium sp.]|nr:hypothetical protein [Lachnoclostridium sp.]
MIIVNLIFDPETCQSFIRSVFYDNAKILCQFRRLV